MLSIYGLFNSVEAILWLVVAAVVQGTGSGECPRRRFARRVGAVAFVFFGGSDLAEVFHEGNIPMWLWTWKITCGIAIFYARYQWRGWQTFRFSDREFLFGCFCMIAVVLLMLLQQKLS